MKDKTLLVIPTKVFLKNEYQKSWINSKILIEVLLFNNPNKLNQKLIRKLNFYKKILGIERADRIIPHLLECGFIQNEKNWEFTYTSEFGYSLNKINQWNRATYFDNNPQWEVIDLNIWYIVSRNTKSLIPLKLYWHLLELGKFNHTKYHKTKTSYIIGFDKLIDKLDIKITSKQQKYLVRGTIESSLRYLKDAGFIYGGEFMDNNILILGKEKSPEELRMELPGFRNMGFDAF